MTTPMTRLTFACLLSLLIPQVAAAQAPAPTSRPLTVVSAGPTGEVAKLAEVNEIRVVFSEPMVALGRIPSPVRAPFFRMSRRSRHLPLVRSHHPDLHARPEAATAVATRYEVTVDTSAGR